MGKIDKPYQLNIRVEEALFKKLSKIAKQEGRTVSGLIRHWLEQRIEKGAKP